MAKNHVQLVQATITDYPRIQKIWPFYVYDLGRECRSIKDWEWPTDESFVPDDLTSFFNDPNKKPFLIKIENKLAGFIFVDKLPLMPDIDFHLSEFFILAKFQNQGFGRIVAIELFNLLKGKWAIGVIDENKRALAFWEGMLTAYTNGNFSAVAKTSEQLKTKEDPHPHPMIIFTFDSGKQSEAKAINLIIRKSITADIPVTVR